jgi:cytochrome c5
MKSFLTIVSLFFVLVIVVFVGWHLDTPSRAEQARSTLLGGGSGVADRVVAVGQINVALTEDETRTTEIERVETESAEPAVQSGEQVYNMACIACHGAGIAGAPRVGDIAGWADRITLGLDLLVNHAINGFQGSKGMMPPKGGNSSLTNDEVQAAVQYMVSQSE